MFSRKELYEACKFEATHHHAEHGMNMSELWAIVNWRVSEVQGMPITPDVVCFWFDTCIDDYRERRMD